MVIMTTTAQIVKPVARGVTQMVIVGSKLKPPELPDGEYLVSLEDEFIVEEDNENNFLIQEPTA